MSLWVESIRPTPRSFPSCLHVTRWSCRRPTTTCCSASLCEPEHVPGIRAIALGRSRARGEATAQSDYDARLCCEAHDPIDAGAAGLPMLSALVDETADLLKA